MIALKQAIIDEQKLGYLPISFNKSEVDDIKQIMEYSPSFKENIVVKKINYTETINEELNHIINGKIPRNFVINIMPLIGRKMGTLKSTFGMQGFCYTFDDTFNIDERVGFTPNYLNEKIKKFSSRKQIWLLDEQTIDLKQSATNRMQNIVEACRERQQSFVLVGVDEMRVKISDYQFVRIGESSDDYLPRKTILYAIKKEIDGRDMYRGLYKFNVLPLTNELWKSEWNKYMVLKNDYEDKVLEQEITALDIETIAKRIILDDEFQEALGETKKGEMKIDMSIIRNAVYKRMPDITDDERDMITTEIKRLFKNGNY